MSGTDDAGDRPADSAQPANPARTPELPVTGYLDRFAARPGESLALHVSLRNGGHYRVRLERVLSGDPNPAGPGLRFEDLSGRLDRTVAGRRQPIRSGSYGLAPAPRCAMDSARAWSLLAWVQTDAPRGTLLAQENEGHAVAISVDPAGISARLTWPGGETVLRLDRRLPRRKWVRVCLAADPGAGLVRLGSVPLDPLAGEPVWVEARTAGLRLPSGGTMMFAAENAAEPRRHFTGRLEAPEIALGFDPRGTPTQRRHAEEARHAPSRSTHDAGAADGACFETRSASPSAPQHDAMGGAHRDEEVGGSQRSATLAAWDFAHDIGGATFADRGPQGCHGRLVNLPTRGVVGARWSGRETCWRHAPDDYAAIHFHDDDLDDCRWEPDLRVEVPADLPSGAYALRLSCPAGEDRIPFYVLPRREGPHAKVAFLASTFTYQAYANHRRGNFDDAFRARAEAWGAAPNPDDFPVYGASTYNRHADRSGIAFSTRLRPILTMRPGFLTFNDQRGSGLRHYPADTHLLAWLEAKGIPFDIVTDEDLDDEGRDLIRPYSVVLTGSHPEYHTPGTLDALQDYVNGGGRLCYLGGNGFYWRIARRRDMPHVIEIRRAEGGIRAWDAEPGEYHNALDGALGGLWRRNRRPPQMLAGVGFSGQGLFEGTHYRRLPASYASEHAWIFEGIAEEILGDDGLSGGGAAGFELDRADIDLGTPHDAAILARSEDPPASFVTVPEELLSHLATVTGENPDELKRAEIVHFRNAAGGEVFAVGSITFLGSLWRDGAFQGPISRMLENVVRRFAG